MHIAYVTVEFVTEKISGGLGTYVDNMAKIMSSHGHKVTVITLSHEDGSFEYADRIRVIRVKEDRRQNVIMRTLLNSWNLRHELTALDKKGKIDIAQIASLHAIGFFRSRKIPSIVRISSDNAVLRNADMHVFDLDKALREKTLYDRMELYSVKHADFAFAPSVYCGRIVARRAGCRVAAIESPYLDKGGDYDESVYKEKLAGKKYLLFNSALSTMKGTHVGIAAADELMRCYPDLHMAYAGIDDGLAAPNGSRMPARNVLCRLSKKYEGRVVYLGVLKRRLLFPIIANAHACVLLSRSENLSNSCIEAMSLKKIVIATHGTSFEQLIRNKENGLLVKRDSPKAFLRAVEYLEGMTEKEREEMGSLAFKSIERLEAGQIYDSMMKVYADTIKNFRRKML